MHHDSIVSNVPPDRPAMRIVGGSPSGVDDRGRVLGVKSALASAKLTHNRIRLQLIAVIGERNGSGSDTIARLRGDEHRSLRSVLESAHSGFKDSCPALSPSRH